MSSRVAVSPLAIRETSRTSCGHNEFVRVLGDGRCQCLPPVVARLLGTCRD